MYAQQRVLFASLRDLQWRLRRFLIGVVAAGLVFALALLISGVSASFHNEVTRVVDAFGVDAWIVPSGVSGPFTSSNVFPESEVAKAAAEPGVQHAEPLALFRTSVQTSATHDLNLVGIQPGGIADPKLRDGRGLEHRGDLVVDDSLGLKVGSHVEISHRPFTVVGRTHGMTYFAGTPVAFMSISDLQATNLSGAKLATAIVVTGSPAAAPSGFHLLSNAQVVNDLRRPLDKPTQTIDFLRVLLWIVAACIIGSIVYLSAMERTRDFAVFKATGTSNRALGFGLAIQAVILAVAAAVIASVLATLLAPIFPLPVEIPTSAYLTLFAIAIVVGLLASLAGLRRAVKIEPALAFGGP